MQTLDRLHIDDKGNANPVAKVYMLIGKDLTKTRLRMITKCEVDWSYGGAAVSYKEAETGKNIIYPCDVKDLWATPDEARAEFNRRRRAELLDLKTKMEALQNLGQLVAAPIEPVQPMLSTPTQNGTAQFHRSAP